MTSDEHSSDVEADSTQDAVSDTSSDRGGHDLIDDEAEESDGESFASDGSIKADKASFSPFLRLPPELRHKIWQIFCPDLVAKARIIQFICSASSAAMKRPHFQSVKDHRTLADQTEALRVMSAVHGESRTLALRKYPDELAIDAGSGDAIVRFKKETDLVVLHGLKAGKDYYLPGFSREVRNIGINPWELYFGGMLNGPADEAIPFLTSYFRNMKRLFVQNAAESQRAGQIRWCVSDFVHTYLVETYQKEPGLGEDTKSLFCWPDVDSHADWARNCIPKLFSRGKDVENGVEMWPLIEFEFEEGVAEYDRLRECRDDSDSEEESEADGHFPLSDGEEEDEHEDGSWPAGSDLDDYESEGIDDGDLMEDVDGSLPPGAWFNYVGRFSSPEPSDEQDAHDDDEEAAIQRPRKRKVIMDSDDDDGDDDVVPQPKRARQHRAMANSDGDDDNDDDDERDDLPVSTRPRRSPSRRTGAANQESEMQSRVARQLSKSGSIITDGTHPPWMVLARIRGPVAREDEEALSSSGEDDEEEDGDEDGDEDEDEDEDEDDFENDLLDMMADEDEEEEDE
ncbi:hypothetical protein AAL_08172 [Moelleriella libera RCEF 2490]|uniref:2EXR domain-containing protein n=1 Tax=Moelleriella libera RCEF 2490 TaxID=1081109 RepID=A0A166N7T3_9HYPO|nr:hypothetical protein AAL_08172 [Moelleriella libera RCEF 2490]